MDSKKKSIAKTVTWRVIALIITFGVAYGISKCLTVSFWTAIVANSIKTVVYYLHERIWVGLWLDRGERKRWRHL
jgi:uncharacterized membrane protein